MIQHQLVFLTQQLSLTNVTNTKLLCCTSPTSETTATILPDSLLNAPLSAQLSLIDLQQKAYCNQHW